LADSTRAMVSMGRKIAPTGRAVDFFSSVCGKT
jgi:hypothetical protein